MLNMSTLYAQIIKVIWKDFVSELFFYPIVRLSWESAIYVRHIRFVVKLSL